MLSVSAFVSSPLLLHVPDVSPYTVCPLLSPSHSYSLSFPLFSPASLSSLLFLSGAQMQRRQLCCVLKCARLKPLCLASAVGKKIITDPHYRHSSLSLSPTSSCHLSAFKSSEMRWKTTAVLSGRKGLTSNPAPLPASSLITTNYWTIHQCTREERKTKKALLAQTHNAS